MDYYNLYCLYQKNQSTNLLIGQKYHWRSVKESLLTFLTSKKMINKYYDELIKMGEVEHEPYEAILHNIYDKEKFKNMQNELKIQRAISE